MVTAGGGSRVAGQGDAHRRVREPGRKLDRQLIVAAAAAIVERDGVRRLAMRGLADQINVPVMSLYRLFPSRDTLLGSVAEYVIDELHTDPGLLLNAAGRWQDYLGRLAHDVRRTALSHPQLFLLTATLPPTSRWTGPPLPSLRWSESFLSALTRYGFADEAAGVFRVFRRFLLGELLGEVLARTVAAAPQRDCFDPDSTVLTGYPGLLRLQPELTREQAAGQFEDSLADMVRQVQASLERAGRA